MNMHRILIIESDIEKAGMTVEKLGSKLEYFSEYSGDAAESLQKLGGQHGYSCIVASYEMPGIQGLSLVERIRKFDGKIGIVVVADDPKKAEDECHGMDVMAVVDRAAGNGDLLGAIAQAIEMTELPQKTLTDFETSLSTQSIALDDLPGTLDAPGLAS